MAAKESKYQCWNNRAQMWVLLKNGRISGMQREKFEGVEISGAGKCETAAKDTGTEPDPDNSKDREPVGSPDNPYWLY